jgi:hypothetical protein
MGFKAAGGGIEAVSQSVCLSVSQSVSIRNMQKLVKKNQSSNGGLIYFARKG